MLQRNKKKMAITVVSLLGVLSLSAIASAAYINTNRDTRMAPEPAESIVLNEGSFEKIYESDKVEYFFRESRDVIAIRDKASGYVWKTGIDSPFTDQIKKAKEALDEGDENTIERLAKRYDCTVDELKEVAETPVQNSFTNTYLAMANSLITIEYFDGIGEQMTVKKISSAAEDDDDGKSSLESDGADNKYKLVCDFCVGKTKDDDDKMLRVVVHITLGDDGKINYNIPFEEIEGEGTDVLSTISITPFLGASGGELLYYNEKTGKWGRTDDDENSIDKTQITPGYVLVPDGCGSLIRYTTNAVKFTSYEGDVYGEDPAENDRYYVDTDDAVPIESPVMPVFGISQGDGNQSAFVAYADKGDEYMKIVAVPESEAKNQVRFTYAYPAFQYNFDYFELATQSGSAYRKTRDKLNEFDVDLTYEFIFGDGSEDGVKSDYTGMALKYRNHLIDQGVIKKQEYSYDAIPIRLDFLMSESKKGVVGTTPVIMTTTDDVDNILTNVMSNGIKNINSGLIGWQKNGESLSKPFKAKYSSEVGKKKDFKELISKYNDQDIQVSLSRDFVTINDSMIDYYNNAAKHNNTQYISVNKKAVMPENAPITSFGYALPKKTAEWIDKLYGQVGSFSNSFTFTGVSDTLVSSHNTKGRETTVTSAIKMYQKSIEKIKKSGTSINMDSPNKYLWEYTDRYLNSPIGSSQYVYETDTVPFLQMVLNGTMEVYAPYSNFSFYSQSDMLRMIDYNISPSFVLTQEPSYLLASTTSCDFYSTEYNQYSELIQSVYNTVNDQLSQVIGMDWVGREVLQDGIIRNTYSDGITTKYIIINYSDESYSYEDRIAVDALSAKVIEGGAN
ncbi:MAG: hypothetical protein E7254_00415 [Lachnospiraceae bacterium]|nr:hypothetical protein [Lachnospiraceae bacterium]